MKSKDFPDPVLHLGEQSCMCEWTEFLLFTASFFARPLLLQDCFGKGHISVLHLHLFIHESLPVSANRAKCVPLSADAAAAILVLDTCVCCDTNGQQLLFTLRQRRRHMEASITQVWLSCWST